MTKNCKLLIIIATGFVPLHMEMDPIKQILIARNAKKLEDEKPCTSSDSR